MLVGVIVQTYLDDIAAAVMKGDFVTYRDAVSLPFHLITHSASLVVSTEQELRVGFETFNKMLISQQVTQYIRLVESAKQLDQTLISSR